MPWAATVWAGGHLVLALGLLPRALRERSAAAIRGFEERFEPLDLTALAIQVGIYQRCCRARMLRLSMW
jgi:hypothetical protein